MLTSLFSVLGRSVSVRDDFIYDTLNYHPSRTAAFEEASSWKRFTIDRMIREFLSRAACRSQWYWPLVMPVIRNNVERPYPENCDLELMVSSSGIAVSLPYDLRVGFARNIVRRNIVDCRRFEIGRVYRSARVERGYPSERTELAVDIVSQLPVNFSVEEPTLVLVDCICICLDLWKTFIHSSSAAKLSKGMTARSTPRKMTARLVINHLGLIRAFLTTLPDSENLSKEIEKFIFELQQLISRRDVATSLSRDVLSNLIVKIFPRNVATAQECNRVSTFLSQLLGETPEWNDIEL